MAVSFQFIQTHWLRPAARPAATWRAQRPRLTTSPVESINCHIKHISKANGKNNASRSLQLITQDTDLRISDVLKRNQRELQLNVIGSKLPDAHLFSRKCVFMLHDQLDSRKLHKCAMVALDSWIVWNFDLVSLWFCQDANVILM